MGRQPEGRSRRKEARSGWQFAGSLTLPPSFAIEKQLRVAQTEELTKVPGKYRYSNNTAVRAEISPLISLTLILLGV